MVTVFGKDSNFIGAALAVISQGDRLSIRPCSDSNRVLGEMVVMS